MMVTTGGRGSASTSPSCALIWSSNSSSLRRTGVCPNSSTTSWAVSWSMGWLMVAITPIFIMVLMTSFALTAMRLASSPTVIVSGSCTSRLTGAVGWANSPPRASTLTCTWRLNRFADCFFLKRAPAPAPTCSSWRPYLVVPLRSSTGSAARGLGAAGATGLAGSAARRSASTRSRSACSRCRTSAWRRASSSARACASSSTRRRASASSRSRSRRSASRCSVSRRSASNRWASSAWRTRSTSSWRCRCSSSSTVRLR